MHDFDEDDFAETDCPYCGELFPAVNLDSCFLCGNVERACQACLAKHKETHTEAEIEAFRQDLEGEDYLTPRERINEELKEQIRTLAETLCKVIDDQESLIKKHERQSKILASEVDRLTLAH